MYFRIFLICVINLCVIFANETEYEKQKEYYMLKGQLHELENKELEHSNNREKDGVLLGVGVGNTFLNYHFGTISTLLNMRVGYEKFIKNSSAGVRAYIDVDSALYLVDTTRDLLWYVLPSANVDFLGDIMLDKNKKYGLSFFAGLGVGSFFQGIAGKNKNTQQWSMLFNIGMGVILNVKHRIDFQMKNTPSSFNLGDEVRFNSMYLLVYQYVF
ncbi:outer membrane beta-barrel protein [Helicobacter anatolicus]|uniref:outer membrane beta-barrel protein n=1 Tax=Helicobacter anatolicus TaxID=2905874 RepID=UPI001E4ECF12|nr:outer membrane beta-barrel protein [Helicobacter anatolicus]